MSGSPTVIVRKGGAISALAHGFFGFLATCVICASGLGFYAMTVFDRQATRVLTLGGSILTNLPEWSASLPPVLSDALNDQRAFEYAPSVKTHVWLAPTRRPDERQAVIEITNTGERTISLLALNVSIENDDGVPLRSVRAYAATPVAFDDEDWQGPLPPGATRKLAWRLRVEDGDVEAHAEIVDLRVWNPKPDA